MWLSTSIFAEIDPMFSVANLSSLTSGALLMRREIVTEMWKILGIKKKENMRYTSIPSRGSSKSPQWFSHQKLRYAVGRFLSQSLLSFNHELK